MIPEPLWHQIVANVPICCVDVAIVQDGRVLLVRRSEPPAESRWWLPGGRVIKGASLETMAWWKAVQEVGLECEIGPRIHIGDLYFAHGPGGHEVHAIAHCYQMTPRGDQAVVLDKTSCDYAWCSDPDDFWVDMGEGEPMPVTLDAYVVACIKAARI